MLTDEGLNIPETLDEIPTFLVKYCECHVDQLSAAEKIVYTAIDEIERLKAELQKVSNDRYRLQCCLEWYGDEENWEEGSVFCPGPAKAEYDSGSRARTALKGEEK